MTRNFQTHHEEKVCDGIDKSRKAHRTDVRHLAQHQVMGLSVQFLLGTAANLLGQPSQSKGAAQMASTVFLAAHVLITVGLAVGAVLVIRATARTPNLWRRLAICGAVASAATTAAGVLTMITKGSWWSYGMAVGFIASLLIYGGLLIQGKTPSLPTEKRPPRNGDNGHRTGITLGRRSCPGLPCWAGAPGSLVGRRHLLNPCFVHQERVMSLQNAPAGSPPVSIRHEYSLTSLDLA